MDKEKEEINNSRSAVVLKTIFFILVLIIVVNCILLISSMLFKEKFEPYVSKQRVVFVDKEGKQIVRPGAEDKTPLE